MLRTLLATSVLAAAGSAGAATLYDPQVAYVQVAGNGSQSLYVANADGTRAVKVASGSGNIGTVDFRPGGGRIVFSDAQGIKAFNYTASNSGVAVGPMQVLVPGTYNKNSPDFSPDGTRIIYRDADLGRVRAIPAAGGAPVDLYAGECGRTRWLRAEVGNAFACYSTRYVPGTSYQEIWVVLLDAADQVVSAGLVLSTETQAFKNFTDFDVARTRNSLVLTVSYPTTMRTIEFDLETGAITDRGALGQRVHFSADDSRLVGTSPHRASGDYIDSADVASGLVTHLTKKGNWSNTTDARP
jgi:hypothetical protein